MPAKNNIPAYVLGVGLTKFIKPRKERAYPEMGMADDSAGFPDR